MHDAEFSCSIATLTQRIESAEEDWPSRLIVWCYYASNPTIPRSALSNRNVECVSHQHARRIGRRARQVDSMDFLQFYHRPGVAAAHLCAGHVRATGATE